MQENSQPETLVKKNRRFFRKIAERASSFMGSPLAFCGALLAIIIWALLGFHFRFSETWQLMVNTGTTIITFLMVFLIQNTQKRDFKSIQLKLDELLRGTELTRDSLMEIEEQSDDEMDELKAEFHRLRIEYLEKIKKAAEMKNNGEKKQP